MTFSKFQKVTTNDSELNRLQDNLSQVFDPIVKNDGLDFHRIESVILVPGQVNKIPHGLGQKLTGWRPVRQNAKAILWDSQDSGKSPELFLYLNTDTLVTVSLEVF